MEPGAVRDRPSVKLKKVLKLASKIDSSKLIEFSNLFPFRWYLNQYRCFCCNRTFFDIMQLREHSLGEHTTLEFKKRAWRVPKGINIKVEVSELKCILCSTPLKDVEALKTHLTSVHDKLFNEERSDALIPFKLNDGTFSCQFCAQKFNSFHPLNQHMNTHYKNIICDLCGAGFPNRKLYNAHRDRQHLTPIFECNICKISFPNRYKKNMHMSREHEKAFVHKCPQCPERFREHRHRYKHLITVHGVTPAEHRCGSCDKTFQSKHSLNIHVRVIHMKERNHECEVCGYEFFRKAQLTKHMSTHGAPKMFPCAQCGKGYNRRDALRQHEMRAHHQFGFDA